MGAVFLIFLISAIFALIVLAELRSAFGPSRRPRQYRMRFDRHDDVRKVERNGFKSRQGLR